jgi:uncharacterized delta-60 repeat protein
MIVRGESLNRVAAVCAALAALIVWLASAPAAGAESMAIQPDGKIVLAGEMWPPFAALARVTPDGNLDPSFGRGGFVVDRRLPALKSVALQPDGRILVGAEEGFRLGRYLPDGAPDPSFGGEGIAGTRDREQVNFLYSDYGPETVLTEPDGGIFVGGTQQLGRWRSPTAIVRRYGADGTFLETVGEVPHPGGEPSREAYLGRLLAEPDGSLIGAGWIYAGGSSGNGNRVLLARFVPGSGTPYDPAFGGGQGLVQVAFPAKDEYSPEHGEAIARDGESLLVAGTSDNTFLLARFSAAGQLDQSFAGQGYARPAIVGTSGEDGTSWAQAIAVQEDGRIVIGGGSSRWGKWGIIGKLLYGCREDCSEPVLARFTADGHLDPSFGDGGLLRLLSPSGEALQGSIEQVAQLPGGKLLVKGMVEHFDPATGVGAPFLARLNPDGSYDPSFGQAGLTILKFPCQGRDQARLREEGCLAGAEVKLDIKGVAAGRPRLSFSVRPDVPWARVRDVELLLPRVLRASRRLEARSRVVGIAADGRRIRSRGPSVDKKGRLFFSARGLPLTLRARLLPGALRVVGKPSQRRKLSFRVKVSFVHGENGLVGRPTVVLRRRGS